MTDDAGPRRPARRSPGTPYLSRRDLLRLTMGAAGAAATTSGVLGALAGAAGARPLRVPDSLFDPALPAGTVNTALPFDHIVVVMMENHSFDNMLGMLPALGHRHADGFTLRNGVPVNANPSASGPVRVYPFPSTAQGRGVDQSWNATHAQIDGGRMDGFVTGTGGSIQPMGYFPPDVVPFIYSLAGNFTVSNRWFCSAPCQTYPNRRFLMAGTAYGDIITSASTLNLTPPPNGTIFDRLHAYGVTWRNYYTDLPQTGIIPSVITKYPGNLAGIGQFFVDCALGSLPSVSFVDPEFGVLNDVGEPLSQVPGFTAFGDLISTLGGSEEDPQDLAFGENWAYQIVNAVLSSPLWPRTLLVYLYDEHGGYYDHVPPPAAIAPDAIPPDLTSTDVPGGYTIYGPRVPAVVVSPYSVPGGASNVVHDHTSVLATIAAKWNLPALTYRDANAATVLDCLDLTSAPALLDPPTVAQPLQYMAGLRSELLTRQ